MRFWLILALLWSLWPSSTVTAQNVGNAATACLAAPQSRFTGRSVATLGPTADVAFFPQQERAAVTRRDRSVFLLNTENGATVAELYPPSANGEAFLFDRSPTGDVMLWFAPSGAVTMHDTLTGAAIAQPPALQGLPHQPSVFVRTYPNTTFSRDGARLAVETLSGSLVLIDGRTGATIGDSISGSSNGAIRFSRDSQRLVAMDHDIGGVVLDLETGESLNAIGDFPSNTYQLNQEGTRAIIEGDGRWYLVDVQTGRRLAEAQQSGWVEDASFVYEGRFVLASDDDSARLIDSETGEIVAGFPALASTSGYVSDFGLQMSPDRSTAVFRTRDGGGFLWSFARRRVLAELGHFADGVRLDHSEEDESITYYGPPQPTGEFRFSADGSRLVTRAVDGLITIWNARTGRVVRPLGRVGERDGYWLSPDGRVAVLIGANDGSRIWRTDSGRMLARLRSFAPYAVRDVELSPNGRRIVLSHTEGAELWDLERGVLQAQVTRVGGFQEIAASDDGRYLLLQHDEEVQLWNWHDGERIASLGSTWWSKFYSVGSRAVVIAAYADSMAVFDAQDGSRILSCPVGRLGVSQDDIQPTGRELLILAHIDEQAAAELWRLETRR